MNMICLLLGHNLFIAKEYPDYHAKKMKCQRCNKEMLGYIDKKEKYLIN